MNALIERRNALLQEQRELKKKLADPRAEAQKVFNLIFKEKFVAGGKWLERTKSKGRRDKMVSGFLGGVKHVFGHLHTNESMHAAMDRQGPNAVIQGPASNIGFISIYLFKKLVWDLFESRGVMLGTKVCNAIHDAQIAECHYVNIPLVIYMLEHCMTTLVHRYLRDVIGYELNMSFETDCVLGPALSDMYDATRWEDQIANIRKSLEWKRDNLGLKQPIDAIMKAVEHNAKIVFEMRRREIQHQLKNEIKVSYTMELCRENCLELGLIFKNPVDVKSKQNRSWKDE